jgi:hypothetical protein
MGTFSLDALSSGELKMRHEYKPFKDKKIKIGRGWGRDMIRN